MKIIKQLLCVCFGAALLFGCKTTSQTVKNYPAGSIVSGVIIQGEKRIALPPGSWKILSSQVDNPRYGISPFNSFILANLDHRAGLFGILIATDVTSSPRYMAARLPRQCLKDSTAIHYVNPMPLGEMDQKCWFVEKFLPEDFNYLSDGVKSAIEYKTRNKIWFPIDTGLFGVVNFRAATPEKFMHIMMFFHPENTMASEKYGYLPAGQKNGFVKESFIGKMIKFGEDNFDKIHAGFKYN